MHCTPIKLEQVLATGSLQGRTCVTCGNITADNACLVCGTRIGGDA
jgi:recombinational DNA repair protein RecR